MWLTNLAAPFWIQVSCHTPLAELIACQTVGTLETEMNIHVDMVVMDKLCVIFNGTCLLFSWHQKGKVPRCTLASKNLINKNSVFLSELFKFKMNIPLIFLPDVKQHMCYALTRSGFGYKECADSKEQTQGIHVCTGDKQNAVIGANLFQCFGNVFVSSYFVCDGIDNCPREDPADERGCTCTEISPTSTKCKEISGNHGLSFCSTFYTQSVNNTCLIAALSGTFGASDSDSVQVIQQFTCGNGHTIPVELLDDLYGDCEPDAEDEEQLKIILAKSTVLECTTPNQIPCRKGHQKCYNISQLCSYKLNHLGHITPCRNGEHLDNCLSFECNMMFKCPTHYCVSWAYLCDGRWDCPLGFDETTTTCGKERICQGMFKCRKARNQVCVHFSDICNNQRDCPYGDDEYLCSLHKQECPSRCDCFAFALNCLNRTYLDIFVKTTLPFNIIHIKMCEAAFVQSITKSLQNILTLSLQFNNLLEVCESILPSLIGTISLDIGHNKLEVIMSHCISHSYSLKSVQLNNNKLRVIQSLSFNNLSNLLELNLKENSLTEFPPDFITNSHKMLILSLLTNEIDSSTVDVFNSLGLKQLLTDDFRLCCLMADQTWCSSLPLWYESCSKLLQGQYLDKVFYGYSLILVLLNISSLISHMVSFQKTNKQRRNFAFLAPFLKVNFVDIVLGVYLSSLAIGNLSFGEKFVASERHWRSSFLCCAGYASVSYHIYGSSLILSFLSIARLMVVLFPLESSFKNKRFVSNWIVRGSITSAVLALGSALMVQNLHGSVPLATCFPFVDPLKQTTIMRLSIPLVVFLQLTDLFILLIANSKLYNEVKQSQTKMNQARTQQKSMKPLAAQLTVQTSSNCLCHVSSCIIYMTLMFLSQYPIELVQWTIAIVITVNPIIYPASFIIVTARK